jgi:drug/metabolite transporter (DMT)-like permease
VIRDCALRRSRLPFALVTSPARLKAWIGTLPPATRAVAVMAMASLMFSCMHALIRGITQDLHPFEVAFFRAVLGIFVLMPVMIRHNFQQLRTGKIKLHAARGILNAIAMLSFFYAVKLTELGTVTALGFTAPLFATVLAALILGEVIRIRRATAIAVGFVGTLIILRPGFIEIDIGPMLIIFSSLVWAFALMVIKVMTRTESNVTITTYASLFLSPITLVAAIPFWQWPTPEQWVILVVIGTIGTLAQMGLNLALKLGDASIVLPIDFTKLIWAAMLGFVLFGEFPDMFTWIGGFLIFASTTYIGVREARLKREGRMAPSPPSTPVDRDPPSVDKTGS